jgi:hypothetical protein
MNPLGSLLLSSVLLGVPRALDARAFGAQRSVYVEVSPQAPELAAFAAALEQALGEGSWRIATHRAAATVVVDVLGVLDAHDRRGRALEAVRLAVHDRRGERRLVLQGIPDDRAAMARTLLERLGT